MPGEKVRKGGLESYEKSTSPLFKGSDRFIFLDFPLFYFRGTIVFAPLHFPTFSFVARVSDHARWHFMIFPLSGHYFSFDSLIFCHEEKFGTKSGSRNWKLISKVGAHSFASASHQLWDFRDMAAGHETAGERWDRQWYKNYPQNSSFAQHQIDFFKTCDDNQVWMVSNILEKKNSRRFFCHFLSGGKFWLTP